MHHFIFPTQDTWISSGSNTITGESFRDQNFGRDQILEVRKEFLNVIRADASITFLTLIFNRFSY